MKFRYIIMMCSCFVAVSSMVDAATLYGSTSAGGPGELYIINAANGAMVQDVGPLKDTSGTTYPVSGLAFHPITGVLYGSTGNAGTNAATKARLVSINPATAAVTVIGSFNAGPTNSGGDPATMGDIAFTTTGTLYGVATIGGPNLYFINTATAQATLIGANGISTSTTGGGLAISSSNTYYATPTASTFGTYNTGTGAFTSIGTPAKPVGGGYAALAFNGSTLYGLNLGTANATHLMTIDTATATATDLGASVTNLDAIAFQPTGAAVGDWSCY